MAGSLRSPNAMSMSSGFVPERKEDLRKME
jgi:hypothetical protein